MPKAGTKKRLLRRITAFKSLKDRLQDEDEAFKNARKNRRVGQTRRWKKARGEETDEASTSPDKTPVKFVAKQSCLAAYQADASSCADDSPSQNFEWVDTVSQPLPSTSAAARRQLFGTPGNDLVPLSVSPAVVSNKIAAENATDSDSDVEELAAQETGPPGSPQQIEVNFEEPASNELEDVPVVDLPAPEENREENRESESESSDDEPEAMKTVSSKLLGIQSTHKMSLAAMRDMWDNLVVGHFEDIMELRRIGYGRLPSSKVLRETAEKRLPAVRIEVAFQHVERLAADEQPLIVTKKDLKKFPRKDFPKEEWTLLYQITETSVSIAYLLCSLSVPNWLLKVTEIIRWHTNLLPTHDVSEVILSNDGVSPFSSTCISLNVFSIKFRCCKATYPLLIFHPERACSRDIITQTDLNRRVLQDLE